MLDFCLDKCLKVSKFFLFFSEKIEKKSKNHEPLAFEFCIHKCLRVSKFHVFFRKNLYKIKKS